MEQVIEAASDPEAATSGWQSFVASAGGFASNMGAKAAQGVSDATPHMIHWACRIFMEACLPIFVLYLVYHMLKYLHKQVMTLYVQGNPNEWVLILNNGKLKTKGIGLSCFRGPFDQVATFPAKVHQVNFTTEQVTNEMQGVQVSGMIVWSINRQGDGPFKAYQNLGEDLASGNPKTANANLVSMSEAIVRTAIAHSSTMQILREREALRQKIRDEMSEVVKGWGVWLETVEITDVVIKSQPVFKDMQAEYRERIKRVAETYRMKIRSEIDEIRSQKDADLQEKKMKNDAELRKYQDEKNMDIKKLRRTHEVRIAIEQRKIQDFAYDFVEFDSKNTNDRQVEERKLLADQELCGVQTNREREKVNRQITVENQRFTTMQSEFQRERLKMEQTAILAREKALAQLKKENIDDNMQKLEAIETAETVFSKINFGKLRVSQEANESDAAASLFNKWFQSRALNE